MLTVGLDPTQATAPGWPYRDWAAFVELHVEQGNVLERAGVPIGLVDLVSGSTRLLLELTGRASHTGGTPMRERADALTAAAEAVLIAEVLANDPRHRGTRVTVGRLDVSPGSMTTIPGKVSMTIDVRDVDSDRQRESASEIVRQAQSVCDRRRVRLRADLLADASPVVLPVWVRRLVEGACLDAGSPYRVVTSGASHDAQMINRAAPSAIIFVPSRNGLSHVPDEWTSSADIATGADVLTRSLLALDQAISSFEDASGQP